ncbi:MAG: hypothetical protein IJH38_04440, partial [Clostridia bacterium]|nr:hypothetical protein [Clostridia bacterium]
MTSKFGKTLRQFGLLMVVILIVIVMKFLSPVFLTTKNIINAYSSRFGPIQGKAMYMDNGKKGLKRYAPLA